MLRAFVGIADCYGLESFLPESEVPIAWLARRATANPSRQAVCYWAVVSDEVAREIRSELEGLHRVEALRTLLSLAREVLPVTSPEPIAEQ